MQHHFNLPSNIDFTFKTERISFRPVLEQDRLFYISLYTDEKIMRLIGQTFSEPKADNAFQATFKAMQQAISSTKARTMTWLLSDNSSAKNIGIMALNWQSFELKNRDTNEISMTPNNEPEIGIILTRSAHGKNLASEAGGGLLEYGFRTLEIPKIHTFFHHRNLAVKRFIKKLNMNNSELVLSNDGRSHWSASSEWLNSHRFINKCR